MSFLKRLFGGTSAAQERAEADRLFDAGEYFDARLAYERAVDKAGKDQSAGADLREHCTDRAAECLDRLALQRIDEALRLASEGELELARGELETAIETAPNPETRERARRTLEKLEGSDAREQAEVEEELDDEQRWAVIAGTWEEPRLDEYDTHGDDLRGALIDLASGEAKRALPVLERCLMEMEEDEDEDVFPVYLWLDVGRARALTGDAEGAIEAVETFLERIDDEGARDARLSAYGVLATLAHERKEEAEAIEHLSAAVAAMPEDPRPYFSLGVYLHDTGHAKRAVTVFEAGMARIDEDRFDWSAWQALGLAKRDAGDEEGAIEALENVVRFFIGRARTDIPGSTAYPLAQIYEKAGNLERAADLYGTLARGSDRKNHLDYHRSAARVLSKLEHHKDARRMLTRAAALAEDDAETLAEIEKEIAELDALLAE